MDNKHACCSFQLVDGDGVFNVAGLDSFTKKVKLAESGVSYVVVSIMGPQSSGKSTLLNHLFGTNFREMDAYEGRSQTTKGVWMARCVGVEPFTLVMDLEGTDSAERGEDDTAFEKQSALFALAISDILLINMWCHDLGREQAAQKPLLKTIFQVMLQLFSPRKTTLTFVIRDKTRTPIKKLSRVLLDDIRKIWDSVPKPQTYAKAPFTQFFNVKIMVLSSYEAEEERFKEQVANLRQQFISSIAPGVLAGDRDVVPASGFSLSAQEIWKVIKENKELDLPSHKVMVAMVRCEEIANQIYASFIADEGWCQLREAVNFLSVPGFGRKLSLILDLYLAKYNLEATFFDEVVKSSKRKQLKEKLLKHVQTAYEAMLRHIRSDTFRKFRTAFDGAVRGGKGINVAARECTESFMSQFDVKCTDAVIDQGKCDSSKEKENLRRDIDAHVADVRNARQAEIINRFQEAGERGNRTSTSTYIQIALAAIAIIVGIPTSTQ